MKFSELSLSKELQEGVDCFNFTELTPIQEQVIPNAIKKKDVLACSQTGSGKTAAFLIPLIELISVSKKTGIQALIICPTRELCIQIEEQITGLSYNTNVQSIAIYGGSDNVDFSRQKNAISGGNTDILVATPGRLISHINLGYGDFKNLEFLVLDEADEMLNMGFYQDIEKIISYLPQKRQNLLFSATMPAEIKKLADKILKDPVIIDLNKSLPAEQIDQYKYLVKGSERIKLLKHLLQSNPDDKIIIFTSTKIGVLNLDRDLKRMGFNIIAINSSLTQNERSETVHKFRSNQVKVLVATNLFARGIDISDVDIIVNYQVPDNPEDYVHRIGRTARAGRDGRAISFVSEDEISYFMRIERLLSKEVPMIDLPEGFSPSPEYKIDKNKTHRGKRFFKKTKGDFANKRTSENKKRD